MQIYFLGTQRQLRFLKGLPVSQSIIIFLSMVSEAFSLTLAFANYVEVILLLSQIHWSDTRCVLFYSDPKELVFIVIFIKIFCCSFAGNWPNFLWDTWIQAFSCTHTYLPFFSWSCSMHAGLEYNIFSSANPKFHTVTLNLSSNPRMFPMELIQSGIFISGSCCINGWRRYCEIHWCHQRIW